MIKKRELALETAAELFLTAFNGKVFDRGALKRVAGAGDLEPEARWFRQTFTGVDNFEVFAGISASAAEALPGELTDFLKNTFRSMARALETIAHTAVSCQSLTEEDPPQRGEQIEYELRREPVLLGRLILAVSESALAFLNAVIAEPAPLHLDALMNVDLPVSISFGTTEMPLGEVLKLTTGSIVEFNHLLNEPVNVVINGCLVARGDVVVVDGNYGVRISEVLSHAQKK